MKLFLFTLLLAAVATVTARAGTTGIITGTVVDDKGAPVADAHIVACSPSDREETHSDQRGHFAFLRLSPDNYLVALDKSGYQSLTFRGITLFADKTLALNFEMPRVKMVIIRDYFHQDPLVNSRYGGDVYNVQVNTYSIFPNDVTMGLFTVPGITFGTGGPIPH